MSEDFGYKAEYAKSNRSSCKACKSTIGKDVLRLAVMVQSPHFDGKQPNWFHFSCFWKRAKPTAVTEFGGFDNLRWDDQEKIRSSISGGGAAATGKKGGKKGKAAADETGPPDAADYKNFTAQYAKSGQSKCRGCLDNITKGHARLAVKEYTSQRAMMYGPQDLWYHVDCFVQKRDECGFTADMQPDKMVGFSSLSKEDQDDIIAKLGKGDKSKKRKIEATSVDQVDSKKPKTEDDAEKKLLKEQNDMLWKFKDLLKNEVSSQAMKGLLEYNNQEVVNAESKLLDRLSDCMVFGALAKCPECSGQLVFGTLTPARQPFKVPEEYNDVEFLKKYKYKKQERIIPKAVLASSSLSAALPLTGLRFFHHGKTKKNKTAIKAQVSSLGGELSSKLTNDVSAVISTKADVDKMDKKMKEIQSLDLPVLSEGFLDVCQTSKPSEVYKTYQLSTWGKPLEKVFTDVTDAAAVKPRKSAAARAAEARAELAFLKDEGVQKMTVKGGAAVDPESELDSVAHILQVKGKPLNAVLSLVDIHGGANSYYKLQVLEHDSASRYWLFRSWGRIGTTIGGTKTEQCGSKEGCIIKFKELFLEKTGNNWESREYVKRPNKFFPIEIDYGAEDEERLLKQAEAEAGKRSTLHESVQNLIKMLFDIESMKKAMLEFEIDMKKMPLGKISKNNITKAYEILSKCQKLVEKNGSSVQLLDASNQFYTLIPHDFGMKKPPILDKAELIKSKLEMLDSLKEIECAYNLLKTSIGGDKDPIDAHYEALKTKIEPMEKDCDEWKHILKYTKDTHAATHSGYSLDVEEVFKIDRKGERSRYSPFRELPNKMLLWHGSRLTNFAGILSQGLRIAPPEAPVTGYMFGKGIYFADMVSKSANYCFTSRTSPTGLLLLCEVALGNMHELGTATYITKLPLAKHSVKGCGRTEPNPTDFHLTKDGVKIPYGKGQDATPPVPSTSLLYNEYIIYDVAQVNIKYLVKCNFKYKY